MSSENELEKSLPNTNIILNNSPKSLFTRNIVIDPKEAFTITNISFHENKKNKKTQKGFGFAESRKPNLHQGRQKYRNKNASDEISNFSNESKDFSKEKKYNNSNCDFEKNLKNEFNAAISSYIFNLSLSNNILKVKKITPAEYSARKNSEKSNSEISLNSNATPRLTEIHCNINNKNENRNSNNNNNNANNNNSFNENSNSKTKSISNKKNISSSYSQKTLASSPHLFPKTSSNPNFQKTFIHNHNNNNNIFNNNNNIYISNYKLHSSINDYQLKYPFSSSNTTNSQNSFCTQIKSKCNSVACLKSRKLNTSVNKLLERFDSQKKKTDLHLEKLKEKYTQELMKNFKEKPEINKNCKYYEKNSECFLKRVDQYSFISKAKKLQLLEKEGKRMLEILNANKNLKKTMKEDEIHKTIEEKVVNYLLKENLKQEKIKAILQKREEEKMVDCTFKPKILDASKKLAKKRLQKIKEKQMLDKEIENVFNKRQSENECELSSKIFDEKDDKESKENLSDLSFGEEKSVSLINLENNKVSKNKNNEIDKCNYKNKNSVSNSYNISENLQNIYSNKSNLNFKLSQINKGNKNKSGSIDSKNIRRINDKGLSDFQQKKEKNVSAIDIKKQKEIQDEKKKNKNNDINNSTNLLYSLFNNSDITMKESNVLKELLQKKYNIN